MRPAPLALAPASARYKIRTYAKAILACGSRVLSFFCRLFFARRAKNNLQRGRNPWLA
jgi:hypothetical protein